MVNSTTDSMGMNLSKFQETAKDRGAWRAVVRGVTKRHDLVIKQHVLIEIKKEKETQPNQPCRLPQPLSQHKRTVFWLWGRFLVTKRILGSLRYGHRDGGERGLSTCPGGLTAPGALTAPGWARGERLELLDSSYSSWPGGAAWLFPSQCSMCQKSRGERDRPWQQGLARCWTGGRRPEFWSRGHLLLCWSPGFLPGDTEAASIILVSHRGASTRKRQASESHEERSVVGYSPWGHKELDMTERLNKPPPQPLRTVILKPCHLQQPLLLMQMCLPHIYTELNTWPISSL